MQWRSMVWRAWRRASFRGVTVWCVVVGTLWCAVLAILCFAFLSCCVVLRYTALCLFVLRLAVLAVVGGNNSFSGIPNNG